MDQREILNGTPVYETEPAVPTGMAKLVNMRPGNAKRPLRANRLKQIITLLNGGGVVLICIQQQGGFICDSFGIYSR
jgi:hypothetical protein